MRYLHFNVANWRTALGRLSVLPNEIIGMILTILLAIDEPIQVARRLPYWWTVYCRNLISDKHGVGALLTTFDFKNEFISPIKRLYSRVLRVSRPISDIGRPILYGANRFGFFNIHKNITPKEFSEIIGPENTSFIRRIEYQAPQPYVNSPGWRAMYDVKASQHLTSRQKKHMDETVYRYVKPSAVFGCLGSGYRQLELFVHWKQFMHRADGSKVMLSFQSIPEETLAVLGRVKVLMPFSDARWAMHEGCMVVEGDEARAILPFTILERNGMRTEYQSRISAMMAF